MSPLTAAFDPVLLAEMIQAGYVRTQRHPELPLTIYNYTEKAQYEQVWNPVTTACRGLIVDGTGVIVARPFAKFFNLGQPGAPELPEIGVGAGVKAGVGAGVTGAAVSVTDKADGSLGVIYPTPTGWAVATRGSFASVQARHATALLTSRYADFVPPAGHTVLVEIVYPANRIVVDYGGLDDLVLLGAVETATGRSFGPDAVPDWPGPVVDSFDYASLAEALAAPPRPNREGLVVHFRSTDTRVKIKYDEYVRLHRLVTGLNARTVWEILVAGGDLDALVEPLPDEFHAWVRGVVAELSTTVAELAADVERAYASVVAGLPADWTRKDFALAVGRHPERACLFLRLDGRDYRPTLWQRVRPSADENPRED